MPKSLDISKALDKAGGISSEEQAKLLKQKRESKNWSRLQLATRIGCTESSVRDWEEGRARRSGGSLEWITPQPKYRKLLSTLLEYSEDERRQTGLVQRRTDDGTIHGLGHSGQLSSGENTPLSQQWAGWGTQLKPCHEPICIARKELEGTVTNNITKFGCGGINIDAIRLPPSGKTKTRDGEASQNSRYRSNGSTNFAKLPGERGGSAKGRWPSNIMFDDDHIMDEIPVDCRPYFYCSKPSTKERQNGCDVDTPNSHPTIKPTELMQRLIRMVVPKNGTIVDPFMGSGTITFQCEKN